jgi:hypothetical protein
MSETSAFSEPTTGSPRESGTLFVLGILIAIEIAAYMLLSNYIQAGKIQRVRERMLVQFTATAGWIVFPVALSEDTAALAVINRVDGHKKLVISPGTFLAFPRFSADGERLLVVRGNQAAETSELLSCSVEDWRCRVLVQAPYPISWPVEVRNNVALYSAGETFSLSRRTNRSG